MQQLQLMAPRCPSSLERSEVRAFAMTEVFFLCVRNDVSHAESLAEVFLDAGFSVGGAPPDDESLNACGAVVIVMSQTSARSARFIEVAQRAADAGKGVVASLIAAPPSAVQGPVYDISGWFGDPDDPLLDALFAAVDLKVAEASSKDAPPPEAPRYPMVVDIRPPSSPATQVLNAEPGAARMNASRMDPAWSVTLPVSRPVALREAPAEQVSAALEPPSAAAIVAQRPKRRAPVRALAAALLIGGAMFSAMQASQAPVIQDAPPQANALSFAAAAVPGPIDMESITARPEEEVHFGLVSTAMAPTTSGTVREVRFRPASARRQAIVRPVAEDPKPAVEARMDAASNRQKPGEQSRA